MDTTLVTESSNSSLTINSNRRMTLLIPLMMPSFGNSTNSATSSPLISSSTSRSRGVLLLIVTVPNNGNNSNFSSDAVSDESFHDVLNLLMQSFIPRGPPPTKITFVESLPLVTIDSELQNAYIRCPVCLMDYDIEEEVLKLPCNHIYHKECIKTWLKQANTCCVCRHELPKEEEETIEKKQDNSDNQENNSENQENNSESSIENNQSNNDNNELLLDPMDFLIIFNYLK